MPTDPKAPAPVPVKGGVVAYLSFDTAAIKASEFYQKAFGAEVAALYPPDDKGRTMHVHLYINGSSVMLGDAYPEHGHPYVAPAGFSVMLMVDDIESWWSRATAAGGTGVMPPTDMFWGDRYAQYKDPFGVLWGMNQQKK